MKAQLLVGTTKGLVVYNCSGNQLTVHAIHFKGLPISMVYEDERSRTWWVAVSHRHWGEKLHCSKDGGITWTERDIPSYQNSFYKDKVPAALKKIWVMQHAGIDRPGGLWLGTEPGGLFYSSDDGKKFSLVESLWNHPSRTNENQWFGAGKDYPFIHSIVLDPGNSDHLYIGISCAGVFETTDGGKSWVSRNKGLKAAYLPNPSAEMGHDPHSIRMCRQNTKVLWQQNHCGIFRSTDGGATWQDVSGANGFPLYGFALAIDEERDDTAFVIPAHSDQKRIPVDLKLTVYKTTDSGKTWDSKSKGLPDSNVFDLVLRHSFIRRDNFLCFGTSNGNLYASHDDGESWMLVSGNLTTVNCLEIIV